MVKKRTSPIKLSCLWNFSKDFEFRIGTLIIRNPDHFGNNNKLQNKGFNAFIIFWVLRCPDCSGKVFPVGMFQMKIDKYLC